MSNVIALTKLELIKYIRQPLVVGFGILFPVMWVFINGAMFSNNPSPLFGGVGTVDYMFPAYIFMVALVSGLSSLPQVLAKNYEARVVTRYSFTPITKVQYITSLVLGNAAMVILSSIVLFLTAKIAFDISIPGVLNTFLFLIVILLVCSAISCLGILIANLINGFQSVLSVSLFVYFAMLFLTGAAIPMPVLPEVLQDISYFIPLSQMVFFLQSIWLQAYDGLLIQGVTTMTCVLLFLILAVFTFRWGRSKN